MTNDKAERAHYLLDYQPKECKKDATTVRLVKEVLKDHGLLESLKEKNLPIVTDAMLRSAATNLLTDHSTGEVQGFSAVCSRNDFKF